MSKTRKKNKPHYPALWFAVQYNNVILVENLLDTGAVVNEVCGKDRGTVLHLAAKTGFTEIVKILLESGADVKKRDRFGNTPLHAGASHACVALELLKYKADVNAKNAFRETPLHLTTSAVFIEKSGIAKELDVNIKDRKGETALYKAVKTGRREIIEALLKAGANVNQECGKDGETVLHVAAKNGYQEVVKLLLKNGADVSKRDKDGNTYLQTGARNEGEDFKLIKYGANLNLKNCSSKTPLQCAGSMAVVKTMIARGVDLDSLALGRPDMKFDWEFVRVLHAAGANLNQACNEYNKSFLHYAAEKGCLEGLKFLLENGADVNKRDCFGNTPLHWGATDSVVAMELIKYKADILARNVFNETPLHYAPTRADFNNMVDSEVGRRAGKKKRKIFRYYPTYLQEVLGERKSKTYLHGKYEKTVSVGAMIFKRAYIAERGGLKRVEFKRIMHSYPSIYDKLKSSQFTRKPKLPRSRNTLKAAKVKPLKHRPKKKPLSSIKEEELNSWDLKQEEKAFVWNLANDKKKRKRRVEFVLSKELHRKRNKKLSSNKGCKYFSAMIRSEEKEYYDYHYDYYCVFA